MPSQTTWFEGLLEAVPDALLGVDTSGMIRFFNHQTQSLFGYEHEDLVGTPLEALLPESDRQAHARYRQGYNTAPTIRPMGTDLKLRGRRRDGTEFPVDVALSPLDNGDDQLVVAAVRDMSHDHSEEADRRRAARLLAIVEYSRDAIIGKTLDGVITSWNPAAEMIYGYSSHEIIGKSVYLLFPKDRGHEMTAILAKVSVGHTLDHVETERVRKDGTVFPVSLSVSPIRDANGTVIGASTIARDVSEAKRAFEAARSMIEASLDSLVSISAEGKITDANEATVKLTGVPRDELIGTNFSEYFTDPEKAEEIYQRVLSEGMAVDYQLTLRRRDEREAITEVLYNASAYRDTGGQVLGVFAAARDVTALMQAQREVATQQIKQLEGLAELQQFQRLTVGRELKIIELKKEIEGLRRHNGIDQPERGDER